MTAPLPLPKDFDPAVCMPANVTDHGLQPAPFTLTVPDGTVEIAAMGTGTLVWDNGEVIIEAVGLQGEPIVNK